MAREVKCPSCGSRGEVAPLGGHLELIAVHRLEGRTLLRCTKCRTGMALGFFSGMFFGNPSPVLPEDWRFLSRCIDDGAPVPPTTRRAVSGAEPGYFFDWRRSDIDLAKGWFTAVDAGHILVNELGGVVVGECFDPTGWRKGPENFFERQLEYRGFSALHHVEVESARACRVAIMIGTPSGPDEAELVAQTLRKDLLGSGFAKVGERVNPEGPTVERYLAHAIQQRTLTILTVEGSRIVMLAAPQQTPYIEVNHPDHPVWPVLGT